MDDEELQFELTWQDPDPARDRRLFKTRPPGVNAMVAIAAVLMLAALGAYLAIRGGVGTDRGLRPLIDFLVYLVVTALVARALSRRIWIAIGAPARNVLRHAGRLGAGALVGLLVVLGAAGTFLARSGAHSVATGASFAESVRGGPLEGEDFAIRSGPSGRLVKGSLDEAAAFCRGKGAGWRLPRAGDEAFLTSRVTVARIRDGEEIAAEPAPDAGPFAWSPTAGRFQRTLPAQPGGSGRPTSRFVVICVRAP